nr:protein Simiate [Ipomoea batatas]
MAELNAVDANSIENPDQGNANQTLRFCSSSALDTAGISRAESNEEEEEELRRLLVPRIEDLPSVPPSAVESNFVTYYAPDFMKPGNDQYVRRHANGLCVIGIASSHVAFKDEGGITAVDFNVGKSDRSGIKVTGKRKKNAQHFESNTALCKVCTKDNSYIVRCCVKGPLLEVNERLIERPELLISSAEREGYIAIIMPKPADWLKIKASLLGKEDYCKLRTACIADSLQ